MLQEETLSQKFIKKGFWLYFFTLFIGPLGYITKVILSRDLSVGEVGMIYGVIGFVSLLSVYNDLGLTESLNFFLPKYVIQKDFGKAKYILFLALRAQIVSSLCIATILFVLAPWLSVHYFSEPSIIPLLRISALFFIGINIIHFTGVLFSVSQDTKIQK
jgi:O-antigen/teichoic acid export membrane protein